MQYEDFAGIQSSLYSAVVSDILDSKGYRHQALPAWVRPLDDSLKMFGRARTALYMAVYEVKADINPYEKEIELIDSLRPGEIPVFSCPQNGAIVPWGELLTTAARARGAAGCLTDGMVRDTRMIREVHFAVFCSGTRPLDSKGRANIIEIDVPIECGGVRTRTGDYVFADVDGALIIPFEVADAVVAEAFKKATGENLVRDELARGDLLRDVFKRHGIL